MVITERLYPSTGVPSLATDSNTVVDGASGNVPETHDPTLKPVEGYSLSDSREWHVEPYNLEYKGQSLRCPSCMIRVPAEDSYVTTAGTPLKLQFNDTTWMCLECGVQRGLVW